MAALGAALCFALNNVALHIAFRKSNPEAAMVVNNLIGTVVFGVAALVAWRADTLPPMSWAAMGWFALGALGVMAAGRWLEMVAIRLLGPSRTASARLVDPMAAIGWSLLVLREGVGLTALVGIALVLIALHFLFKDMRGAPQQAGAGQVPWLGLAAALGATLSITGGHTARKLGLRLLPSPLLGTAVAFLLTNVFYVVTAFFSRAMRERVLQLRWSHMGPLLVNGACSAAANYLTFVAVLHAPLPVALTLRHTAPWWTMALSLFLLRGERVQSRWVAVSAAVGLAGVWLIVSA